MDAAEIGLRLVGLFYAFAGYAATRAGLTSYFLDQAIAAIAAKRPSPVDTAQAMWLLTASTIVMIGGILLMLLIDWAAWVFVASVLGQIAYLFYLAPRYFDVEDELDPKGRQGSMNAFVIYGAATALVIWALLTGKLHHWSDVAGPALAVAGAAGAGHIVYVACTVMKPVARGGGLAAFDGGEPYDRIAEREKARAQCKRIKVMAEFHAYPLWALDEDLDGDFPPYLLDISGELAEDLACWADDYTASKDPDVAFKSLWSETELEAHAAKGRALAARLAQERPDLMIYVLQGDIGVVQVHSDSLGE